LASLQSRDPGSGGVIRGVPSPGPGGVTLEIGLILFYILITRLSLGVESRYGIWIGSVPIFPTDVVLVALIAFTYRRRPRWFRRWILSGKGAGSIGRATWCLCVLAIIYFALSFRSYGMFAVRDLAIFGYSAFYPLAYIAIRDRQTALRVMRYFIYGSLILGVPLAITVITGWKLGLPLDTAPLDTAFGMFDRIPIGDLGFNLSFSFSAAVAYLLLRPKGKLVSFAVVAVCIVVIASQLGRTSAISTAAIAAFSLLFVRRREGFLIALAASIGAIYLAGHSSMFKDLLTTVKSGILLAGDPDFDFRLMRWAVALTLWLSHPVLGAGFGVEINPPDPGELGLFNAGMPHNTYLMVLDRMGIIGLGLFLFCLGRTFYSLAGRLREKRSLDVDALAITNILLTMSVCAGLHLFLEEPLLNAPFWIMLAVACRLAGTSRSPRELAAPKQTVHAVIRAHG
jgi:hypothetical protein